MLEELIGQIKAELAASRKKATVLGLLMVVVLFIAIRAMVDRKAASAAIPAVETATATADVALDGSAPTLSAAEKRRRLAEYVNSLEGDNGRNLFKADFRRFPSIVSVPVNKVDTEEVKVERKTVSHPVLTLQSTLNMATPTAIINGQVLAVGQSIENCTVIQVGKGFCILRTGESEFKLKMDSAREQGR